jgi:putative oxidoreductase
MLKYRTLLIRIFLWMEALPISLARIVLAFGFYTTGRGKLMHIENVVEFFTNLGIPYASLQAPFVARLEYYGGIALALGLLSRPVAGLLASTMAVALLTADKADFLTSWTSSSEKVPAEIVPFTYLILLLFIVFRGGGPLSLDYLGWRMYLWKNPPAETQSNE